MDSSLELQVVGIIRPSEDAAASAMSGAVGYTSELAEYYLSAIAESDIIKEQLADSATDVFTGLPFENADGTEPSVPEKAAAFIRFYAKLSTAEKAEIYKSLSSACSEDEISKWHKRFPA